MSLSIPYLLKKIFLNTQSSVPNTHSSSPPTKLVWVKPSRNWYKLNVDGYAKNNAIAAGGIIRKDKAKWITEFMKFIGTRTPLLAEAWALLTGLQIASDIGIKKLEIETDCQELFCLLNNKTSNYHPLSIIVLNCRHNISKFEDAKLLKIKREQNLCTDKLAKEARKHGRSTRTYITPPFVQ